MYIFVLQIELPLESILFPYTTLFRSRVDGPFGRIGRHDVEVVEQAQRAAGVAGSPREPGDQVPPAGSALVDGRFETGFLKDSGQELRRRRLVPRWVRGVDAEVLAGDLHRFVP